jgi:RES domain-containing protein
VSFKSWRSYWNFSNYIQNNSRYILDDESKEFLDSLYETCEDRIRVIKSDSIVWRAQNGHDWEPMYQEDIHVDDIPCPFSPSRMKPLPNSATEGRANPKGIPYLYVATNKETAMSEVRPWLGATLSAGQFKINKELKIVDFSVEHGLNNWHLFFEEPSDEEKLKAVWTDIDNAFSKPTESTDVKSEYAPTQIIAEFIKSKGYDGIAYKSSLADGHNIVLFDLNYADLVNCSTYEVKKIELDFSQSGNPYFVQKNT